MPRESTYDDSGAEDARIAELYLKQKARIAELEEILRHAIASKGDWRNRAKTVLADRS